jgi:outer membrane protein TolC
MTAMEMMMKSFGIDPEQIKQQALGQLTQVKSALDTLNTRLARIENKLDQLIGHEPEYQVDETDILSRNVLIAPHQANVE